MQSTRRLFLRGVSAAVVACSGKPLLLAQKLTNQEALPAVGHVPDNPGPLATDISSRISPADIRKAIEKVGYWEHSFSLAPNSCS